MEYGNECMNAAKAGMDARRDCQDINKLIESIHNELSVYKTAIPNFFSSRGEADGIRKLYNELENRPNDIRIIPVIDLCVAGSIYSEYVSGMLEFIHDVFRLAPTCSDSHCVSYREKIQRAEQNNSIFIRSLFGGENNESSDKSLKDACGNIEYLIDFVKILDEFNQQCGALQVPATDDETMKTLIVDSVRLYFDSIGMYCSNVLECVFKTYDMICDSLQYPYGKQPLKPEVPKYQLF